MEPSSYRYCSRCFAPIASGLTICGECSGTAVEGVLPAPPELLHLRYTFRRKRRMGHVLIGVSLVTYAAVFLLVSFTSFGRSMGGVVLLAVILGLGVMVLGAGRLMEGKEYRAAGGLWSLSGFLLMFVLMWQRNPHVVAVAVPASLLPTVALLFVPDRSERKIAELRTDKIFDT